MSGISISGVLFRYVLQKRYFCIIKLNLSLYIHEISKARSCLEQAEKFL